MRPRSAYRVQLRPGFGFREAAEVVGYLSDLGVSHLYLSPVLQAVPGSEHGYDVIDHSRVSEDLGGEDGWRALVTAVRERGLGILLDVVPNHMAVDPGARWWWDVLENGRSSLYALFFDISWDPPEPKLRDLVLLPILADHYGRELERGALRLERTGGAILLRYGDRALPVSPGSLDGLLRGVADATGIADAVRLATDAAALPSLGGVPPGGWEATDEERRARHRAKEMVRNGIARLSEDPTARAAIDREIARLNGDADALDDLLQRQHYRVAFWRTAAHEVDYRRFFDINELVALRVEERAVFDAIHERVIGWVRDGSVDGVRIDHVDGLRDPTGYLERLREALGPEAWIVVEKILHRDERLRASWPIEGTTGYEALDLIGGLFVDPQGEREITAAYGAFTGERRSFEEVALDAQLEVLRSSLTADVERVTALFVQVCERHRRHRDHTRNDLREVIRAVAAALAVYRTYARANGGEDDPEDRRWLDGAIGTVRKRHPDLDPELLRFLRAVVLREVPGDVEQELAMRFQQLTPPIKAKGVEDTAFYRYSRLLARNEVGSDPGRFAVSLDEFHRANGERLAGHPRCLVATSTHDTKRGEDVRARLAVLSEMPGAWADALSRWSRRNERYRTDGSPDREDEHLFYQTLVGAYPLPVDRALAYVEKAAREAKRSTSWTAPDERYERALAAFVRGALADETFLSDLGEFTRPLVDAGRVTSLAQTLIKLTVPGVPDIYQGTELWDTSLVDPDNRRPVDFARRRALLDAAGRTELDGGLARMDDGLPKMHVVARALRLRRDRADLFDGAYEPLEVRGERAEHAVAYARGGELAVVVPRLALGLAGERPYELAWGDTEVVLPGGTWCDQLTGVPHDGGARHVGQILERYPVAMLVRERPDRSAA